MMLERDNRGKISVNVPVILADPPLSDSFKETYQGIAFDCVVLEKMLGYHLMVEAVNDLLGQLPIVEKYLRLNHPQRDYSFIVHHFYGTPEKFAVGAKRYADLLIPLLESADEGKESYVDQLPSAVEDFVYLCDLVGAVDVIQRVYDSLWQEDHPYHPLESWFNLQEVFEDIDDLTLHKDHPGV